jgi:hypothetical protein
MIPVTMTQALPITGTALVSLSVLRDDGTVMAVDATVPVGETPVPDWFVRSAMVFLGKPREFEAK